MAILVCNNPNQGDRRTDFLIRPASGPLRKRSQPGWGLVHFSAVNRVRRKKTSAENMDLSPFAAQGGQSHFRGENVNSLATSFPPRKSGQSPVNGYAATPAAQFAVI